MFIVAVIVPASASALVTRTYVSRSGSDANDCTAATPCATFQRAHDQTLAGGEVNALEPGDYSSLTINHPITIDGNGTQASITPYFGTGVTVDLANGAGRVVLRDIRINVEANFGTYGIDMLRGGTLVVDNLRIWGGTQGGIRVRNSADPGVRLLIDDSRIQGSSGRGMTIEPSHGYVRATVRDTGIDGHAGAAILLRPTAGATARATVRRSDIDANGNGLAADATAGGTAVFSVFSTGITDTGLDAGGLGVAIYANGANATARIARNEIQSNVRGLQALNSAKILSAGDNDIVGNTVNGVPTGNWPKG